MKARIGSESSFALQKWFVQRRAAKLVYSFCKQAEIGRHKPTAFHPAPLFL